MTLLSGHEAGRAVTLADRITLLGRGPSVQLRFDDRGVSLEHARITAHDGGGYLLEDLASTNGTFVGNVRVERADLGSGDRIRLGATTVMSFSILDAQVERMKRDLYDSSMRDPLTRAYNRRYFAERLASEMAYARRHGTPLSLVLFDLDPFKGVNDSHGHQVGDQVLRDVAIDHGDVERFAERLRASVEGTPFAPLRVTISAGSASVDELPDEERTGERLLRMADERLYRAKAEGRNRVCGG